MGKLWTDAEVEPHETVWRKAKIHYVSDGDTIDLHVDVGLDIPGVAIRTRLLAEGVLTTPDDPSDDGVDAWEKRGPERELGKIAARRAETLCPLGGEVRIYSQKGGTRGSFRRWLCVILYPTDGGWKSLGDTLIEEGHAEWWSKK